MIDELAALIREGYNCPSKETIEEMLSFVVKPDGKAEAEADCFDDRVITSAIRSPNSQDDRHCPLLSQLNRQQNAPESPQDEHRSPKLTFGIEELWDTGYRNAIPKKAEAQENHTSGPQSDACNEQIAFDQDAFSKLFIRQQVSHRLQRQSGAKPQR